MGESGSKPTLYPLGTLTRTHVFKTLRGWKLFFKRGEAALTQHKTRAEIADRIELLLSWETGQKQGKSEKRFSRGCKTCLGVPEQMSCESVFAPVQPLFDTIDGRNCGVSRRGGRNKGGRKQMRANASKRRQTRTNASKRRGANASKREQT